MTKSSALWGRHLFVVAIEKKGKKERKKKTERKRRQEKDGRKKTRRKRTGLKTRHYNGRIPEELIRGIA